MANFANAFKHFTMAQLLDQQKLRKTQAAAKPDKTPQKFGGVLKSFTALSEAVIEKRGEGNPFHAPDGKFTSGGTGARSEGGGAVSAGNYADHDKVMRADLKIPATRDGQKPITLKMKQDVLDQIRAGTYQPNPSTDPGKYKEQGDFFEVHGYKLGDTTPENKELGAALGRAWAYMDRASDFAPAEAAHQALRYKADAVIRATIQKTVEDTAADEETA